MRDCPRSYLFIQRLPPKSLWQRCVHLAENFYIQSLSYLALFPPFRALLQKSFWGVCGYIEWLRRKGKLNDALDEVITQLQRFETSPSLRDATYERGWYLLKSGVTLAQVKQLHPDYRLLQQVDELTRLAKKAPLPHVGYDCAYVYVCLGLWAFQKGDTEIAVAEIFRAIEADDTWGYPYYLMGWLGCFTDSVDPVGFFLEAISCDWSYLQRIQRDPICQHHPDILRQIRQKLLIMTKKGPNVPIRKKR